MKQPASILIFILVMCLGSCSKTLQENKLFIRGRLFLLDTLAQNQPAMALAHRPVQLLKDTADALNFFLEDSTDANGYFIFSLLDKNQLYYLLRFEDTVHGIAYKGLATAARGNDTVQLVARLDTSQQNGFVMSLRDSAGGLVPSASVLLYNSEILAETNDATGAIKQLMSDAYGKVYQLNLPLGPYFLNAKKASGNVTLQRLLKKISIERTSGLVTDTMLLKKTF